MNWFKKAMLFVGMGVCIIGLVPTTAQAKQVGTFEGYPVFDNEFNGVHIEDVGGSVTLRGRGASYPVKYVGKVSNRVENQGNYNTCWAFAAVAAMEGNIIQKGYEDNTVNLSENHLAYFFYNRVTDPVGYTEGDSNMTFGYWANNGGLMQGTALHLTTWAGAVKERTSEDDAYGEYKPQSLATTTCYNSDYRVANTYFFNYNVNTVKQAIMDYGAVAAGIYIDAAYWNASKASYYCPLDKGNHAVTIVGWDDSYSRNNFASNPGRDGAWVVKNSYGSTFGDGGYMYVSYADASLTEIIAYDMVKTSGSYDRNYQYDGSAAPGLYYYQPSGTTVSNVYRVKSGTYNEELKAVAINVYSTNVNYTVQIYTGVTGSSPTSGKSVYKQSGTLTKAGYNQIVLKKAVTLAAKEKYAVVIKLTAPNGGKIKIGCDASMNGGWIQFKNTVGKGQSYVKVGKKWYDTGKSSGASKVGIYSDSTSGGAVLLGKTYTNVRIKAYTDNTTQKTTYKLSSKNLGVSKGSTAKLSLTITPSSVKRKVKWTSSNKAVATVSSSGKVTGKSYGTTTIKATFVAGKSNKTLKCKVTVGPAKVKNFKVKGAKKKVTVSWKASSGAGGYEIYYSKKKSGGYKKLAAVTGGSKTKYSGKLKKGTYYVKMRPYMSKDGKKLYGSYTSVKTVKVK